MTDWSKIYAVTRHTESRGRDRTKDGRVLRSPAGAMGRMQVMPATARDPGFGIKPWNGRDLDDLARVGEQLLQALARRYNGDMAKAWAAYNWGAGRVDNLVKRHGSNWFQGNMPAETRNYVTQNMRLLGGNFDAGQPTYSLSDPRYWEAAFSGPSSVQKEDLKSKSYWDSVFFGSSPQDGRQAPKPSPSPSSPDLSDPGYWERAFGPTNRTT